MTMIHSHTQVSKAERCKNSSDVQQDSVSYLIIQEIVRAFLKLHSKTHCNMCMFVYIM